MVDAGGAGGRDRERADREGGGREGGRERADTEGGERERQRDTDRETET